MSHKFDAVTVEKDTTILFQAEATLGEYDVLYQKWVWDGITAESIIFLSEDIKHLDDQAVEAEVRTSPLVNTDSNLTLSHSKSGYTFVNFNSVCE